MVYLPRLVCVAGHPIRILAATTHVPGISHIRKSPVWKISSSSVKDFWKTPEAKIRRKLLAPIVDDFTSTGMAISLLPTERFPTERCREFDEVTFLLRVDIISTQAN